MFYYIVHYFTQWTQDCNWQTQTTRAEMARNVWWLGKMDEQKIQKGKNNTCSILWLYHYLRLSLYVHIDSVVKKPYHKLSHWISLKLIEFSK